MTLALTSDDREIVRPVSRDSGNDRSVVITGGAGFVGCNLAARLLAAGRCVVIYDNISRPGVRRNVAWLRERFGDRLDLQVADVRDREMLIRTVQRADVVYHFAAQVAVTTSLADPIEDFSVNAIGTLNVLEAIRAQPKPPPLIYTSTNKVYGDLADVELRGTDSRYEPLDSMVARLGIGEDRPLDFHSPYGCSKGAADQYVHDYARSFGLRTVVFRMSCIYGPRQFGNEDQGWLAHFLIRTLNREPIALYGDGLQVRDALFVDDLVNALVLAERNADRLAGHAFNIGGGPGNTISLLELLARIEVLTGARPTIQKYGWRTGDQRYFVADTRKFQRATGWAPRVDLDAGIAHLYEWLRESRDTKDLALAGRPRLTARSHAVRGSPVAANRAP